MKQDGPGLFTLGLISLLMGFASISTDLYLPALPTMARALHASPGQAAFTISGYLLGFSLTQLFWGPVSDRHGRRAPVAAGLVLFIIGSAGCALAGSGAQIIASRIVQAMGACAGVVLARAMVRDFYTGHRAAQMLSFLMTIMAIAPLLGPLIGGQILALWGWRAIFVVLVGVGGCTLAALAWMPESLPPARRHPARLAQAFGGYAQLLKSARLLGYAGACGFFFGGTFAYIAASPFAYITYYHLPAQAYGLFFGAGIVGIMGLNMLNARLIPRFGSDRMMLAGNLIAALAGLALMADARRGAGGIFGLAVPLFLFVAVTGLISANALAGAMGLFAARAGAVSALVGCLQYGAGVGGSALVGAWADGTPWPMALIVGLCALGALLCAGLVIRPGISPRDQPPVKPGAPARR